MLAEFKAEGDVARAASVQKKIDKLQAEPHKKNKEQTPLGESHCLHAAVRIALGDYEAGKASFQDCLRKVVDTKQSVEDARAVRNEAEDQVRILERKLDTAQRKSVEF